MEDDNQKVENNFIEVGDQPRMPLQFLHNTFDPIAVARSTKKQNTNFTIHGQSAELSLVVVEARGCEQGHGWGNPIL